MSANRQIRNGDGPTSCSYRNIGDQRITDAGNHTSTAEQQRLGPGARKGISSKNASNARFWNHIDAQRRFGISEDGGVVSPDAACSAAVVRVEGASNLQFVNGLVQR